MEPQKAQNCQSDPEEKEQSKWYNPPRLQTILQSYSNQNSVILAQNQTHESMEETREPRNKPTQLMISLSLTKETKIHNRKSLFSKWYWES